MKRLIKYILIMSTLAILWLLPSSFSYHNLSGVTIGNPPTTSSKMLYVEFNDHSYSSTKDFTIAVLYPSTTSYLVLDDVSNTSQWPNDWAFNIIPYDASGNNLSTQTQSYYYSCAGNPSGWYNYNYGTCTWFFDPISRCYNSIAPAISTNLPIYDSVQQNNVIYSPPIAIDNLKNYILCDNDGQTTNNSTFDMNFRFNIPALNNHTSPSPQISVNSSSYVNCRDIPSFGDPSGIESYCENSPDSNTYQFISGVFTLHCTSLKDGKNTYNISMKDEWGDVITRPFSVTKALPWTSGMVGGIQWFDSFFTTKNKPITISVELKNTYDQTLIGHEPTNVYLKTNGNTLTLGTDIDNHADYYRQKVNNFNVWRTKPDDTSYLYADEQFVLYKYDVGDNLLEIGAIIDGNLKQNDYKFTYSPDSGADTNTPDPTLPNEKPKPNQNDYSNDIFGTLQFWTDSWKYSIDSIGQSFSDATTSASKLTDTVSNNMAGFTSLTNDSFKSLPDEVSSILIGIVGVIGIIVVIAWLRGK